MLLNVFRIFILIFCLSACGNKASLQNNEPIINSDIVNSDLEPTKKRFILNSTPVIKTEVLTPDKLVEFAKTLIGTPYLYGSTDPNNGFDCSGFITYVFNHFKVKVPRSSIDFTNEGTTINIKNCQPGDLILFTGTDSTQRAVGHMGIITETKNNIQFIQATSGKAYGVTITPLNKYYQGRFVKIIRLNSL